MEIIVVSTLVFLLISSAAQGVVKTNTTPVKQKNNENSSFKVMDDTYTWEDTFNNQQKIDMEHSENYIVDDGQVKMYGT